MRVKIVDWELADFGDACWDVGAILQAYLSFWVLTMPVTVEATPEQFVEQAQYPLEAMQPAIRAFWKTYIETSGADAAAADELLDRSVQYGAARMIQTAYESMYYQPQITSNTLVLLQASMNILQNPKQAIRDLLGL